MEPVKSLSVFLGDRLVGTLARYETYRTAFQYAEEWRRTGFSISPLSLPLTGEVFLSKPDPFDGLFGVFADSLPDGWGRLLVDRMLLRSGENPETLGALERLAIVGSSGMGALEYRPSHEWKTAVSESDYDALALSCARILASANPGDLATLYALGGSSGGARPKVLVSIDGEDWIVKFPSSYDPPDIGRMEYDYMTCARACGIAIPEIRLIDSKRCSGYFAVKRFDRALENGTVRKVHTATASALLGVSHRVPALDYLTLLKLTWKLTRDNREVERMYRLMCFNVFSHNRDDHSNNFSFLCRDGVWTLAPAYDLTYSESFGGEHATTVNGNGKEPGRTDLLAVADRFGLDRSFAETTADTIQETVSERLSAYSSSSRLIPR